MNRPDFITNKHLIFLDVLRLSGNTNMYGAVSYIEKEFPELLERQANIILTYWMETFGQEDR